MIPNVTAGTATWIVGTSGLGRPRCALGAGGPGTATGSARRRTGSGTGNSARPR